MMNKPKTYKQGLNEGYSKGRSELEQALHLDTFTHEERVLVCRMVRSLKGLNERSLSTVLDDMDRSVDTVRGWQDAEM